MSAVSRFPMIEQGEPLHVRWLLSLDVKRASRRCTSVDAGRESRSGRLTGLAHGQTGVYPKVILPIKTEHARFFTDLIVGTCHEIVSASNHGGRGNIFSDATA
jgi:hypothetical protein